VHTRPLCVWQPLLLLSLALLPLSLLLLLLLVLLVILSCNIRSAAPDIAPSGCC
jgi:hypothetical protein